MLSQHIENIKKETGILKRSQNLELKNLITEMKNSLERFKIRFTQTEERIRDLKDRALAMQSEDAERTMSRALDTCAHQEACLHA